jgi:glycerol-3-phosphate cytidylyltransferase-like family protein|tara:strand:- start:3800 stop:4015 length:216 start_codon:yes stop_codon:yes gene_type:complete
MDIIVIGALTFGTAISNELSLNNENTIDIFVMGNSWEGKFNDLNEYCKVIYFPRTKGISTTKLKAILKDED